MVSERAVTGITGLDNMLEGGIPRGRIIMIVGGPGTGKTIFSTQFLVNGIINYDEPGIFVSLEETKAHIYQAMRRFNWDLSKLEKGGKFSFLDASPIRRSPAEVKIGKYTVGKRDFSMLGLINTIEQLTETTGARRIVVDPLASLIYQYPSLNERRTAFLDLIESLTATGATCVTTMESHHLGGIEREVIEEEYLAHGVIVLQRVKIGKSLIRVLQIRKMRMTAADDQPRPYKIDDAGISVFAEERLFDQ